MRKAFWVLVAFGSDSHITFPEISDIVMAMDSCQHALPKVAAPQWHWDAAAQAPVAQIQGL